MNKHCISFVRPLSYLALLPFLLAVSSCHRHKKEAAYFSFVTYDQMVNKIDVIVSNHPKPANADKVKIIDSLYGALPHPTINDLCEKYVLKCTYSKTYPDTEELYADSALMVVRRKTPDEHISSNICGRAFFYKANALFAQHKFTDAYQYYSEGIKNVQGTDDTAMFLSQLGQISYDQGNFLTAARYFKERLWENYSQKHDSNNFLVFYQIQGNLDNIGLCYDKAGMPDTAIAYYNKALNYMGRHETNFIGRRKDGQMIINSYKGLIDGNLGTAYQHKGNLEEAERLFKKDISINKKKGYEPDDIHTTQLKLVDLYLKTSRIKEAGHLLDTVKMECDSTNENPYDPIEIWWYKLESTYHHLINEPREAFSYASAYATRKDSSDNVNKQLSYVNFNNLFSSTQEDELIATLKKNDAKQNIDSIIAFFILSVLIGTGVFVSRNNEQLKSLNAKILSQNIEMKQTLDALEQSQRENTRMLEMVVNDLRDPIGAIMNMAGLLLEEEHTTETRKDFLMLMKASSTTLIEMTKEVLSTNITSEGMKKEEVDMKALLGYCIDLLKFKAAQKNQVLLLNAEDITMKTDREKIWRVMSNLITNAIKFSPEKTSIEIELHKQQSSICISVKDSGIGIPDELKDKIFDASTPAKSRPGTHGERSFGLDLSISKRIVEILGGKIGFESTEGQGATFYVEFPENIG